MNTLDELALKCVEDLLPRGRTYSPEVWVDFAHRLVAELAKQEPVAWLNKKLPHMAVLAKPDDGGGWFPVYAAPVSPAGEVAVTTDEDGRCVAVTRQNEEGQILSVIWEAEPTPAGWVMVPEEPTEEMKDACYKALLNDPGPSHKVIYKAMLSAAPKGE